VTQESFNVPLRWRDLDHQGHVYHATVLTLLDEARTQWLASVLGITSPDEYVVARVAIDYRGEIRREDEQICVTFGVERLGNTSVTIGESVRAPDGRLLADASVTAVMWDRAARRPRTLLAEERERARQNLRDDALEVSRA
jgi:acyl-CoA thioester hydrolase